MFPQVNSIFRKKNIAEISQLKIAPENKHILDKYNINTEIIPENENNEIIVNNIEDKLNVIGAFLANINKRK